jgi:nucleoporin NUP159
VRFNKAKNDKEFAKMLKSRSLGPELSETQTHLRKSIRVRT